MGRMPLFIIILFALLSVPLAVGADPCTELRSGEQASKNWLRRILGGMAQLVQKSSPAPLTPKEDVEQPLHFTVVSDFSTRWVCEGQKLKKRDAMLYPIGLIVQPMTGTEVEFGSKKYIQVIAEHGLRMYLRKDHLRLLESGKTFLFANTAKPVPYCVNTRECDLTKQIGAGRVLSARDRYAVVTRVLAGEDTACGVFEIEPFNKEAQTTREKGFINPCLGEGLSNLLKQVSLAEYRKRFAGNHSGEFVAFDPTSIGKFLTNNKPCGYKVKVVISGGAEVTTNIYVFSANLGFKVSQERALEDNQYYFYSHYLYRSLESRKILVLASKLCLFAMSKNNFLKLHTISSSLTTDFNQILEFHSISKRL